MLSNSCFDHLVIAVPNLQKYVEQCEVRLGVAAVDGGAHPGLGTANALLGLELSDEFADSLGLAREEGPSPLTYLEILGPDPEQDPALAAARLAGIIAPTVQRWAIRPDDFDGLVTAAARSREPRVHLGEVRDMTRRRPDGTVLDWRLSRRTPLPWSGIQPFLIDWKDSDHPARQEMPWVRLEKLWAASDAPAAVGSVLDFFGIALDIIALDGQEGETEGLHAHLKGPGGSWTL
ncbi:VOC family protein [Brevibacterium sp. K11IcPPYGO002]|uniref:VOC family protein n=1 Tax=Brevibacterium sp. K11IcPPYGO002 TaxID=3058837 RepID=UPI003D8125FC